MPRRLAVLADVHGCRVALEAVLADAGAAGAQELYVGGDVVNFGPESNEVVDLLRARGAQMIRGNHEQELVATYGTAQAPPGLATSRRFALSRWTLRRLGSERLAFLAGLPDRLAIDAATVVVHGSPRRAREGITAARSDAELAAMFAGEPSTLAFAGHTHRPLLRHLPAGDGQPARRIVNVGSAGFTLDGDARVSYALAEQGPSGAPGDWRVEIRRLPYDVERAVAAYENGLSQECPGEVELLCRQLRTGRSYFGRWVRSAVDLRDEALEESMRHFLAANP